MLFLLPVALAQDAIQLEILRTGQVGTSTPAFIVNAQQAIADLQVDVRCGSVTGHYGAAASAGQRVELPLAVPVGQHDCTGSLSLRLSDGSEGEMPLSFQVQMLPTLELSIDRDSVDLEAATLTATLSRPAAELEITAYGLDGITLGAVRHTLGGAPAGEPITVEFDGGGPEAEVIRLEVRAQDSEGFWTGVELFPWFYSVPHEDVVFASNDATIRPEYEVHLQAAMAEIRAVQERYGAHAEINLYVGGFTDTVGSAAANRALSERRAKAISSWFQAAGLTVPVFYQGFGEDGLAVQTGDEVDEAANRRAAYIVAAQPPPVTETLPGSDWKALR